MKLGKFDLLVLAAIDNDRATSVMSTTTVELVLVDSSLPQSSFEQFFQLVSDADIPIAIVTPNDVEFSSTYTAFKSYVGHVEYTENATSFSQKFLPFYSLCLSKFAKIRLEEKRLAAIDSNKKLIPEINSESINELINSEIVTGGMIPKINNCLDVASNGVKGVVIIDGRKNHSLLFELLSDKGSGTLIRQ